MRTPAATNSAAWRPVYDQLDSLRVQHGCTAQQVLAAPGEANDLLITHDFPSVERADAFAHDPALRAVWSSRASSAPRGSRSSRVSDFPPRPRPGRGASRPSPAAFGLVRVAPDFEQEFQDADRSSLLVEVTDEGRRPPRR